MTEQRSVAVDVALQGGAAAYWRQTLWAMVGIQFVMTGAFSMLTPIMKAIGEPSKIVSDRVRGHHHPDR